MVSGGGRLLGRPEVTVKNLRSQTTFPPCQDPAGSAIFRRTRPAEVRGGGLTVEAIGTAGGIICSGHGDGGAAGCVNGCQG